MPFDKLKAPGKAEGLRVDTERRFLPRFENRGLPSTRAQAEGALSNVSITQPSLTALLLNGRPNSLPPFIKPACPCLPVGWGRQGRWEGILEGHFIRLRRRPRLRAETPGHFGVQARPMAVDECEEDNPPKPCAWEGVLRRIPLENMQVPRLRAVTFAYRRQALRRARALSVGLHNEKYL